ncbi:MAG: RnfABCDGE type electron transport complex subunit D [Nitrospirae bacterium]|nr:MAG: RnfABCDGE type electron transport complex subunit D [Nitrospirota bacterium]
MEQYSRQKEFLVSLGPHIRDKETISHIMWIVILSLLPAFFAGVYFFGPKALLVTALCVVSSVFFEYIMQKIRGRKSTLWDGSAVLTGLLLGMNLPSSLWSLSPFSLHVPVIGSFIAIVITKQLFGGLGYNVFNPALTGRAFLLISWPRFMTTWVEPTAHFLSLDAKTTATPLGIMKEEGMGKLIELYGDKAELYWHLFWGLRPGSIGEVSVLALLIGACFLLYKRYITWHIPIPYIATVALLAWIFGGKDPESGALILFKGDPIVHIMSGGLILGAFFMATDYVTCPITRKGQIVFGIGCGILTVLIRLWAGFPEGVMFAILLMNCFAPLIDRGFKSVPFGHKRKV